MLSAIRGKNQEESFGWEGKKSVTYSGHMDRVLADRSPVDNTLIWAVFLPTPEMFEGHHWRDVGSPVNQKPKSRISLRDCSEMLKMRKLFLLSSPQGAVREMGVKWGGGQKGPRLSIMKEPN